MSDVFISYSRKNNDFVHKLNDALAKLKRDVWADWQDIARGEDWWRSIQVGIDSADTALIVVTENWLVSEICHRELDYIRQQNKRVFPIIRQKIEGDVAIRVKGTWVDQDWEQRARDNWKYLRSLNWLFFDDDATFDSVFKDLITALDTDQLHVKSHTHYLVRALEWQQFQRNPSFLLEGDQLESAKTWLDSSANKHPEPHPAHHEYVTASKVAETARIARDKAREQLIRRFRQAAIALGLLVIVSIVAMGLVGQQFFSARAEVTRAGATLQQVNIQVTDAINQQSTAVAQVQAANDLVITATNEQGKAVSAQRTSFARENFANTQVAVAGATLSPVPPTLTAVASAIEDAYVQQDIALQIANASVQMADNKIADGLQIVNDMVAAYPDQALALLGRGLVLDGANKLDEAIADYTRAIQIDPQYADAYNNRATVYLKQNKIDEAVADFTSAITYNPEFALAYSNRGSIYRSQQKFDEAIADLTRAIELSPEFAMAYFNRAGTYYDQNMFDETIADYTQALEIDPTSAEVYNNRGVAYYNLSQFDEAISDFSKAIELNPMLADAYDNRGNGYKQQGKMDQAMADYAKALEVNPQFALAYFNRAGAYYDQGEIDEALANYTQAIEANPEFTLAYNARGLLYYAQYQLDQAIVDYTSAIELDPQYADAHNNRGVAYYEQGNLDQAIDDYTSAIAINANDPVIYNNRGNAYKDQGMLDEAVADYTQAIELNPEYTDVYNSRGHIYTQQEKFDAAIADHTKAVQLNPEYAYSYVARGFAYGQQGKFSEALADYWKWVQLNETKADTAQIVAQGKTPFTTTVTMTQEFSYNIPFEGVAGQSVQARAVADENTALDPLLIILDPLGSPIFYSDDLASDNVNAAITDYVLPADGVYTLVVSYAGGGSEGTVDVTLDLKPVAAAGS